MLGRGDIDTYTSRDRLLLVAYEAYEQSICEGCGYSTLLTTHSDYDGHFAMQPGGTCLACAAKERWQKENEKKDPTPGARHGVVFTGVVEGDQIVFPKSEKAVTDGRS